MADSQRKMDWNTARGAALDCLNATWDLVCWAERSQEGGYDVDGAALHLGAIDRARDTFRRAMEVLQPGFERADDESVRYSPVFDALALATVGEGARPDFRFGATAHETAFEQLRRAILWVENGLNDELDETGAPDNYLEGIDDLHKRSPKALRDTLRRLEERESLQGLLSGRQCNVLRAWIDREWAAVSRTATETGNGDSTIHAKQTDETPDDNGRPPPQYVTLDQCAALVNRSKRTLERLKSRKANPLPPPDVEGGGGKPDEWKWSTIRPYLASEYARELPERFPSVSTG